MMQPFQYFQCAMSVLSMGASFSYYWAGQPALAGAFFCYSFASLSYAFL